MNRKAIFLDVDGTLVRGGEMVPVTSAMKAIDEARKRGHMVFLCTGRNLGMAAPLMQFGFDGLAASAGAYLEFQGKVIHKTPLSKELTDRVRAAFEASSVLYAIEAENCEYDPENLWDFVNNLPERNLALENWLRALERNFELRKLSEYDYDKDPAYKFVIMCRSEDELAPIRAMFGEEFNFIINESLSRMCLNGEMAYKSFDKGVAVRMLCEAAGIPIEDSIGFGDSMNDQKLIEAVDLGICMGNGAEGLKRISDLVCDPIEDDGIYKAFQKLNLI